MLKFWEFIFLKEIYFYLIFSIVLLILWLFKRNLIQVRFLKLISLILPLFILCLALLKTIINYFTWLNNPLSRNLLPPSTSITYFLRYSFQHYFFAAIVTIAFAYFISLLILWFNKKFQEIFFYDEEPYFASIGILLTGWPGCLFYLCLVLFLGVVYHFFFILVKTIFIKRKRNLSLKNTQPLSENNIPEEENPRLSLFHFWLPAALLVLILNDIISKWNVFQYFKI